MREINDWISPKKDKAQWISLCLYYYTQRYEKFLYPKMTLYNQHIRNLFGTTSE